MLNYCEKKKILLFILTPYTSYLIQPLDIGIFQTFKHYYNEAVNLNIRIGNPKFSKHKFLQALRSIQRKTFKSSTIKHAFAKIGLYPYNLDIILEKLQEIDNRPTTP